MEWHIPESCGNSPKNKMIIDWLVAFGEQEDCSHFLNEGTVFSFRGKEKPLTKVVWPELIEEITLYTAITHGKEGVLHGKGKALETTYEFALILQFSLGKTPRLERVICILNELV